jgi:DNA polymerase III subunit delta'
MSVPDAIGLNAVRGHERVRDFLRTASTQDRLAHALLFAGIAGIGKYALARGLAAFLQCEQRTVDACGECPSCVRVAAGSHPDVQTVAVAPGKKEIGVERMRELKRFVQMQPVFGRAKMAIVDDAHMLTVAAQNALLKTLEEPPARSFLVLVSNAADALLPTVRSRCQLVRFAPLPDETVVDVLQMHGLEVAAAHAAARLAEGSPGRALLFSRWLTAEARVVLDRELAALENARYVALMRLAQELNRPDAVALQLEVVLSHFRDDAVRAIGAAHLAVDAGDEARQSAPVDLRAALRRADAVHNAWSLLRRGNPNRQLLLEGLLLQLARA